MREIKFREWAKEFNKMLYQNYFHEHKTVNEHFTDKDRSFMQYTGLKDKNRVEIYEGDIIKANIISWTLGTMGEIVFDIEHSCYCNKNEAGLTQLQKLNDFEVIGNIYENPELLKD